MDAFDFQIAQFNAIADAFRSFEALLPRIDRFPEHVPLHRVNAGTLYKRVMPFAIIASDWPIHVFKQDLFYLFLTLDDGWVQVSLKTGLRLLQYLI